jgi:hypothetical protein
MGANSEVTMVNEAMHSTLTAHHTRKAELITGNVRPCSWLSRRDSTSRVAH